MKKTQSYHVDSFSGRKVTMVTYMYKNHLVRKEYGLYSVNHQGFDTLKQCKEHITKLVNANK